MSGLTLISPTGISRAPSCELTREVYEPNRYAGAQRSSMRLPLPRHRQTNVGSSLPLVSIPGVTVPRSATPS
jgi:hypothetical protein